MADMGSQSSRMPSVAIEGLQDWQCEELLLVQKGSLIEVAVFSRVTASERDEESDEVSEQSGDEKEDAGRQEAQAGGNSIYEDPEIGVSAEASGESTEVNEPDTPPTMTTTNAKSEPKRSTLSAEDLHTALESNAAALTSIDTLTDGTASNNPSPNDLFALHASVAQPQAPSEGQNTGEAQGGPAEDQIPEVVASEGLHEDADQGNSVSSEEDGRTDASEYGDGTDNEDEDEEDFEEAHSEGEEGGEELWRDLYVVLDVKTADDANSTVTDLKLRKLTYQHRGEEASFDTYRIYGKTVKLHDDSVTSFEGEEPIFLREIIDSEDGNTLSVTMDPPGDDLRHTFFDYECPADCHDGWQQDVQALRAVYSEDLPDVRPFRPICPVCVGEDLMNEQMTLRLILDTASYIDIGQVVEHLGTLNPRRRQLGYSFEQFDEREWGYGFDDMLDESDYDEEEGDEGRFEHWDEAMDPNANPKTRPASEDTIAALPKKKYEAVTKKEDGAFCAICQEGAFGEESVVVELCCGHVYDVGCLEAWVREYDNCPECRATVSGMVGGRSERAAKGDVIDGEDDAEGHVEDDVDDEADWYDESDGESGDE